MTTTSTRKSTQPTHRLYCVAGEGKSAIWLNIGAAWPNKDGVGFSLAIHAMPMTSRIVMREISDSTGREEAIG